MQKDLANTRPVYMLERIIIKSILLQFLEKISLKSSLLQFSMKSWEMMYR